jgi:hypothetical protein
MRSGPRTMQSGGCFRVGGEDGRHGNGAAARGPSPSGPLSRKLRGRGGDLRAPYSGFASRPDRSLVRTGSRSCTDAPRAQPLPRSWGRGRRPSRGTSERPAGRGPPSRSDGISAFTPPSLPAPILPSHPAPIRRPSATPSEISIRTRMRIIRKSLRKAHLRKTRVARTLLGGVGERNPNRRMDGCRTPWNARCRRPRWSAPAR